MLFKEEHEGILWEEFEFEIHEKLRWALKSIDMFCRLCFDKEIVVTDLLRPVNPNRKSWHPINPTTGKGHGADIRTHFGYFKDEQMVALKEFISVLNKSSGGRLQVSYHPEMAGTASEHIHLEWDIKVDGIYPV